MKNLVFVVIIVATLGIGVGFLNNTNGMELWIEKFGIGQETPAEPVTDSSLEVLIEREEGFELIGDTVTASFKDFIVDCVFISPNEVLLAGTTVICKLLNGPDAQTAQILAEGEEILENDVAPGTPITVHIDTFAFEDSNNMDLIENTVIILLGPPVA